MAQAEAHLHSHLLGQADGGAAGGCLLCRRGSKQGQDWEAGKLSFDALHQALRRAAREGAFIPLSCLHSA